MPVTHILGLFVTRIPTMIKVTTPAQVAQILLSARKAKGMTQAEAATYAGVGQPRLSLLETTATGSISLDQMLALFAIYGLELFVQPRSAPSPSGGASSLPSEW